MKTAGDWNYTNNQGIPKPSELNSDGYPTTISNGGVKSIVGIFPASVRSQNYVIKWDGNGTIGLGVTTAGMSVTPTSGSLTSTRGSGRVTFSTTEPSGIVVAITAVGSPIISNIRLCHVEDEALLEAGQIFGTRFLTILRAGKPGVLRFLDWANANTTNVTEWSTRKTETYFSYYVSEYRSSLDAGLTKSSGLRYSATFGSGVPVDKQTLHLQFNNTGVAISSGSNSVCTWQNHGLKVGSAFLLVTPQGVSLPRPLSASTYNGARTAYWVTNVIDANRFNFSATKGGPNIDTTGAKQVGVPLAFAYPVPQRVTIKESKPGEIRWTDHGLSIGDPFSLSTDGAMPSGLWGSQIYYVSANNFTSNSFQFSLDPEGPDLDLTGATGRFSAAPCATFNLNGKRDVPILAPWGDPIYGANAPFCDPRYLIATLVYDEDLKGWLKFGGDVGGPAGLINGVPIEIEIALCKAIGAHPHFCAPFLACDPMTDWHKQLASYVKNSGPSWMAPRFEGCNETWNFSLGFFATRYGWNKSPVHWGSSTWRNQDDWYGKIISTIGQDINSIYGGTPGSQTSYAVICANQTISASPTGVFNGASNARLDSTRYVNQTASSQKGYRKSAAYNWVTDVALANYWSPGERDTPREMIDAFAFGVTHKGNPRAQDAMATAYVNTSNSGCWFIGTILGNELNVTSIIKGGSSSIAIGSVIRGNGVASNTRILGFGSGTGGVGSYIVTNLQVVRSGSLFTSGAVQGSPASDFNLVNQYRYAADLLSWARSRGSGQVTKMCGYEGGYSPDYPVNPSFTNNIRDISRESNALVTVGPYRTSNQTGVGAGAAVGMPIVITGVSGMMQINNVIGKNVTVNPGTPGTVAYSGHGFGSGQPVYFDAGNIFLSQLPKPLIFGKVYYVTNIIDANTFTISATLGGPAVAVLESQSNVITCNACWVVTSITTDTDGAISSFAINADSTGFGHYQGGGTVAYGASRYLITLLRRAGKFVPAVKTLTTQLYDDFLAAGGQYPSCYVLAGGKTVWSVWDPNIFLNDEPPQWAAISAFNK